ASGSSGHLPAGRAGPGRADAKLSDEGILGLTGPTVGEGCRAHAHWRLLPSPSLCFLKLRPNLQARPPRCVNTHALLPPSCLFEPPTCNL
ncbi:unnamed protein product, partial [Gulo gulo]